MFFVGFGEKLGWMGDKSWKPICTGAQHAILLPNGPLLFKCFLYQSFLNHLSQLGDKVDLIGSHESGTDPGK